MNGSLSIILKTGIVILILSGCLYLLAMARDLDPGKIIINDGRIASQTTEAAWTPMNDTAKEAQAGSVLADTLKYCVTPEDIGVGGYDLVSYFESDIAEKGSSDYQYTYDGVSYYFISNEHKKLFAYDVEKFLPAYGGWCSMTLAMGRATMPTYDNFKIIDDTLYLFEKTLSINGRILWLQNPVENKQTAAENYLDYLGDGQIK